MGSSMEIQIADGNGDVVEMIAIPTETEIAERETAVVAPSFLDKWFSRDFRDAINASPIFYKRPDYKTHYNLACAVMDRLDTCVFYLNEHQESLESKNPVIV